MNRDKQIIEIKECIDAVYGADCAYFDVDGFAIANEIYNADYRKAEDVAREIFEEIYDRLLQSFPPASFIDAPCTTHDRIFDMIAELKKKYLGEDNNVTTNAED